MVRTRQTARKCTGGPAPAYVAQFVPAPAPAPVPAPAPAPPQPMEDVEEDPEMLYYYVEDEDGQLMPVDSPAHPAPEADAPPPPPAIPAPDAPAPAAAGGDPDDSGDDSDDSEDEGDGEDSEGDGQSNNDQGDSSNNNSNSSGGQQGNGPRVITRNVITSLVEPGYFSLLLQDVLTELGNNVNPLYFTYHYTDSAIGDYYITEVHIRERMEGDHGMKTSSAHDSTMPHSTYATSISSAARRALWSLCHTHRQVLHTTEYRHVPRRASGSEQTMVALGEDGEHRVSTLARVTAALNTDLECLTTEYEETHEKLREAQDRISQLEAQLTGQAPPPD